MSGFRTKSGRSVGRTLSEFADRTEKAATDSLRAPAEALKTEAVSQLGRPGSGRLYHRRGGLHRASAAGQPPAPDSHALQASVRLEFPRAGVVRVIADAPGAASLELGTKTIAPRPFLRTALEAVKKVMTETYAARLRTGGRR